MGRLGGSCCLTSPSVVSAVWTSVKSKTVCLSIIVCTGTPIITFISNAQVKEIPSHLCKMYRPHLINQNDDSQNCLL